MAKRQGYRSRASYLSRDPAKRERQLANLKSYKRGRPKGQTLKTLLRQADIITFATEFLGLSLYPAQEVLLRCLYGLPLSYEQVEIYQKLTGNSVVFEHNVEKTEGVWVLGARSGKSFLSSIVALYEATAKADTWRKYLSKDEVGYVVVVSTRQKQAEQIIGANCARLIENSRLSGLIDESWSTELKLTNGLSVISMPCNSTAARGLPICCLIMDEVGHFRVEGVRADETIYSALRPRMAQFPAAKVMLISTPSAKQGLLWDFFSEGFQVAGRLTAQAETLLVNPTIDEKFVESEYRRNPDNAEREFGAKFAEKVDAFFPYDRLQDCFVLAGDAAYNRQYRYACGIDQSGLAGRDRFGFAVSHAEGERVFVDCVRSWDTKSSEAILKEIETLTKAYGIRTVTIDRYGAGWVQQALEKFGLEVKVRDTLPVVYANAKSLVVAGRLRLPDNRELKDGLQRTQAYYSKSNTLSIGHERTSTGHADLADAAVTAVYECSQQRHVQAGCTFLNLDDDAGEDELHERYVECGTIGLPAGW